MLKEIPEVRGSTIYLPESLPFHPQVLTEPGNCPVEIYPHDL